MVELPTLREQQAREQMAFGQAEVNVLDTQIKPRITPEIIEEHRRRPIGKHSDALERVLVYLRKHHLTMAGKYVLVCTKPHEEWRIAQLGTQPDAPPELLDEPFGDRFEAEHGLFVKRLRDNGLMPDGSDS